MSYYDQQKELVNQLRATSPEQLAGRASLIPLQADYKTDPALALTTVTFIPPLLAGEITHAYQAILPLQSLHLITCNAVCQPESRIIHHTYHLSAKNLSPSRQGAKR